MSTHPYSIAKQLLAEFSEIEAVRVINHGGRDYGFMLKLSSPGVGLLVQRIQSYIEHRTSIGIRHAVTAIWVDGPMLPTEFSVLNEIELAIIENCSGTSADIVAAIHQAFDWVKYVIVYTIGPGHIGIRCSTNSGNLLLEQEHRLRAFVKLINPPDCNVTVKHEPDLVIKPTSNNEFVVHAQNSSHGILDPEILRFHQSENDVLRTAFSANFGYDPTDREKQLFEASKSRIVLPQLPINVKLKSLMVLYDKIFYPIPHDFKLSESNRRLGVETGDLKILVNQGKLVPVFLQNFSRYDPALVRELMELGPIVSSQYLSTRIALDWHLHHPLWTVGQSDFNGFVKQMKAIKDQVARDIRQPELRNLGRMMHAWLDYERDSVLSFSASIYERGALTSMAYGPGSLYLKLAPILGKDVSNVNLEIMSAGAEISAASALAATCFPFDAGNSPFYEFLANLHQGRDIANLAELEVLANLEAILSGLEIAYPSDISIDQWVNYLESSTINQFRRDLIEIVQGMKAAGAVDVKATVAKLKDIFASIDSSIYATEKVVDRFDILGVAVEATLVAKNLSVPFLGWTIGVLLKNNLPKLWQELIEYPIVKTARDSFVAMISKNQIQPVRLHRLSKSL